MVTSRITLVSVLLGLIMLPETDLRAQVQTGQEVMVLPIIADGFEHERVWELYDSIMSGLRPNPWMQLISRERAVDLVGDQSVSDLVSRIEQMDRFTSRTGVEFLIGVVMNHQEADGIEITCIIYSAEDREILHVQQSIFEDMDDVVANIGQFARDLSNPNNFSTADVSLLYSILVPGLGQINQRAYTHAAVCIGLMGSAVLYGLMAPSGDPFVMKHSDFEAEYNSLTEYYDFYVRDQQVSEEEFYRLLEEDLKHNEKAEKERRDKEAWQKRTVWMLVAGYAINLLDTLWLVRRGVDTSPFYLSLEAITGPGLWEHPGQLTFRVGIRFFLVAY